MEKFESSNKVQTLCLQILADSTEIKAARNQSVYGIIIS